MAKFFAHSVTNNEVFTCNRSLAVFADRRLKVSAYFCWLEPRKVTDAETLQHCRPDVFYTGLLRQGLKSPWNSPVVYDDVSKNLWFLFRALGWKGFLRVFGRYLFTAAKTGYYGACWPSTGVHMILSALVAKARIDGIFGISCHVDETTYQHFDGRRVAFGHSVIDQFILQELWTHQVPVELFH